MKRCSRCKLLLPESEFYKDKRTPSGLKSQCKKCHTEGNIRTRDNTKHRVANREYMRRARLIDPSKFRERERIASKSRPIDERVIARRILNIAVRSSKIIKPNICQKCGKQGKVTAYHNDYSKPLEVEWWCYECHSNI